MESHKLSSSQFAKLCGITKDALVWYEKKGLMEPDYIGENGYHYYSYEQYFDVDIIKTLKAAGASLEECKEYIRNRNEESFVELLLRNQDYLSRKISSLRLQKADVDLTIRDYLTMQSRYSENPRIILKGERYLLTEPVEELSEEGTAKAFRNLFANRRKFKTIYKSSTTMLNGMVVPLENLKRGSFRKPAFVCLKLSDPIPEPCCMILPRGEYAVLFHTGKRSAIDQSYYQLMEFIEAEGAEPCGNAVEADFANYLTYDSEEEYIKQISIPIRRR